MTEILRVIESDDRAQALQELCHRVRTCSTDERLYTVDPLQFEKIPTAPFAYWVTNSVINSFAEFAPFSAGGFEAWVGLQTNYDFQWVRTWWENSEPNDLFGLAPFFKGGSRSPFYSDVYLGVRWGKSGRLIKEWKLGELRRGAITANNSQCWNEKNYFNPGVAWPSRTLAFSPRALPRGCVFAHKGPAIFSVNNDAQSLLAAMSLMNSSAFMLLIETRLNAADKNARSYEVGIIEATPLPEVPQTLRNELAILSKRAWGLMRAIDSVVETSRAFHLPAALRARLGDYDTPTIEAELTDIKAEIDGIAFDLYGFSEADRTVTLGSAGRAEGDDQEASEVEDSREAIDQTGGLLNWVTGVAFGRFDWRLATGEREPPPVPDPFDPLPAKSPGMLPDGVTPFHAHQGILVDDRGHSHDLARLIEEVLVRVNAEVPDDVRSWLQRDFFPLHLKQYSKSRRKAPIYWPLSTASVTYTLWVYYPGLTDQTLYTAANDFLEPKLKQVSRDVAALRDKGTARSGDDEMAFEALQTFELELIELRDTLLAVAPNYRPNHDDGVQITAAPLWRLFRHRPWQKILKDTWEKLEKGDYDWAHLAMAYWPDRVRKKCTSDKSLAIAHDLEHLYVVPGTNKEKGAGG